MKIVVLTPNTNSKVTNLLYEALLKRNIEASKIKLSSMEMDLSHNEVNSSIFSNSGIPEDIDGIIGRGIGTNKIKKIYFRLHVYKAIEFAGVPLINSRECMELATNKILTTILLKKNGIKVPETIACESYKKALLAYNRLGSDVVLKPMYGSKGRGLIRITDEGLAENVFYHFSRIDEPFYLQKFYNHGNSDIRAFVIGNEVVAAMERVGSSWKTNISKGAIGKPLKLSSELEELSIKSAQAVKAEIAGIDIIKTNSGNLVLEVNAIPGIVGLQKTTKIDVADEMVKYCIDQFRK